LRIEAEPTNNEENIPLILLYAVKYKPGFKGIIKHLGYKLPCDDDKHSNRSEFKKNKPGLV